ncbi:heparinase II/III family protein, partial [Akkermansiaceae bacterium]|nr:heparinase II/III family protein [Akkermansiaceae bacterium]
CLLYGWKHQEKLAEDSAFRDTLLDSIGRQVAWLERNLEIHIQANHLLENLCALMCVASVFRGPDRIRLQKCYQPQLANEVHAQILPDGMHYERSPMYHLRVMWLLEMLKEVGDSDIQESVRDPLERANEALVCMSHPDGEIAQLNDAAIGIYADSWSTEAPNGAWSLPEAGYYGYRYGGDYLVIDSGPVGPDHQPGHAHADLLSFELSFAGHRVITDTGIGTYEKGDERSYDRSTAAHSTLEIAGENSVEVWGGFRVGRRVVPNILRWEPSDNGFLFQ